MKVPQRPVGLLHVREQRRGRQRDDGQAAQRRGRQQKADRRQDVQRAELVEHRRQHAAQAHFREPVHDQAAAQQLRRRAVPVAVVVSEHQGQLDGDPDDERGVRRGQRARGTGPAPLDRRPGGEDEERRRGKLLAEHADRADHAGDGDMVAKHQVHQQRAEREHERIGGERVVQRVERSKPERRHDRGEACGPARQSQRQAE